MQYTCGSNLERGIYDHDRMVGWSAITFYFQCNLRYLLESRSCFLFSMSIETAHTPRTPSPPVFLWGSCCAASLIFRVVFCLLLLVFVLFLLAIEFPDFLVVSYYSLVSSNMKIERLLYGMMFYLSQIRGQNIDRFT